jgi:hypothetical protein
VSSVPEQESSIWCCSRKTVEGEENKMGKRRCGQDGPAKAKFRWGDQARSMMIRVRVQ